MTSDDPSRRSAEEEALRARLDALGGKLAAREAETPAPGSPRASGNASGGPSATGTALGVGFRAASELAGGLLVGGFVGWWVDRTFGTKPFGIVIFLLLGMVAGGWNVYRVAAAPTAPRREAGPAAPEAGGDAGKTPDGPRAG